jgi:uncharacterized membrane-anchored protein
MTERIAVVILVVVLLLVNGSIASKERHLATGSIVYLALAPKDPRSLMQGDYMALRFTMSGEVYANLPKKSEGRWHRDVDASDGFAVVALDDRGVGTFRGIYTNQPLAGNERLMRYRIRWGEVKFATNAFFFQEGQGSVYDAARFGQFRVDGKGELLLTALADRDLTILKPDRK